MATKSSPATPNPPPPEQGFPSQLPYPFPPGGFPPFFGYPPHPDGNADPANGQPGPPPFMHMPMMFMPGHPYPPAPPPTTPKHKRKQVKMACTNCASACKRCDVVRPCNRCKKYGLEDSCQNGQRKERKRGAKRGPYKRKNNKQGAGQESAYEFGQGSGDPSEWPGSPPPDASSSTSPNQGHPPPHVMLPPGVPFPPGAPDGMHPMFFSPPPPHMYGMPPEAFAAAAAAAAAQGQDPNAPPPAGHPPPMVPFYMGYPPFAYHPGAMFPMPPGMEPKRDENENGSDGGSQLESRRGEDDGLTMTASSPAKTSRSGSEESEPSAGLNIPPMSPA